MYSTGRGDNTVTATRKLAITENRGAVNAQRGCFGLPARYATALSRLIAVPRNPNTISAPCRFGKAGRKLAHGPGIEALTSEASTPMSMLAAAVRRSAMRKAGRGSFFPERRIDDSEFDDGITLLYRTAES